MMNHFSPGASDFFIFSFQKFTMFGSLTFLNLYLLPNSEGFQSIFFKDWGCGSGGREREKEVKKKKKKKNLRWILPLNESQRQKLGPFSSTPLFQHTIEYLSHSKPQVIDKLIKSSFYLNVHLSVHSF
jgi:hypothetical protein